MKLEALVIRHEELFRHDDPYVRDVLIVAKDHMFRPNADLTIRLPMFAEPVPFRAGDKITITVTKEEPA